MRLYPTRPVLVMIVALALAASGCAARLAYRQGQIEAKKGNWDVAVARLTKALDKDPDNISYKMALVNARVGASRYHYQEAKKHLAASELDQALEELDIAVKYDGSNRAASDELRLTQERVRKQEEERQRREDYEATKTRAAARVPIPVLSPRSPVPLTLKFNDTSLEKVFESMGKLSGVNILMDPDFRDKRVNVNLTGVTFEEALDQLTLVYHLFYKVLDQNTIIVVPESPQKRRTYDDTLVRTFYLQNADVDETLGVVRNLTGLTKIAASKTLGAITVMGTPDKMALAEKIIEANDKAKGEVLVEVQILEVNRQRLKDFGIQLSNYEGSVTFSPTGTASEVGGDGFTTTRAQFLSSLNLSDYIVKIPSTLLARFLESESNARLLAAPRLRAAEGKKTSLKIGTEIAIPVTSFTAQQAGTVGGVGNATSFQSRNVGVNLELTPKVNANGDVTLELAAEFSSLGNPRQVAQGLTIPDILTRNVNGILRLKDGETSLLGGLIQTSETDSFVGLLGLSSIPILNKILAPPKKKQTEQNEVLISITPHVVRSPRVTEDDLAALYAGTEEVVKVPGARPPLFGTVEPGAAPSPSPSPVPSPSPGAPQGKPIGGVPPAGAQPPPGGPATPLTVPTPEPAGETPPAPEAAPSPSPGPARTQPMVSRWTPPQVTLKRGDSGALTLALIGAHDVLAVELSLSFDASVLEVGEIAPGALLSLDGASIQIERQVEFGKVRAKFTRKAVTTGSGAVAVLTVKALQPGLGVVSVDAITVTTPAGTETPITPTPGRVLVAQ